MKRVPHGLHFVCANGRCDFYQAARGDGHENVQVDAELIPMMAALGII